MRAGNVSSNLNAQGKCAGGNNISTCSVHRGHSSYKIALKIVVGGSGGGRARGVGLFPFGVEAVESNDKVLDIMNSQRPRGCLRFVILNSGEQWATLNARRWNEETGTEKGNVTST